MKALLKDQENNHIIDVDIKEHYGQRHVYIVSEHKEYVTALTGHKTITESDINALKALGFKFETYTSPVAL